ncbi:hypothetical protein QJS10_CPB12g00924 [Acorus calamus]|uniref:Uncharacterized protein n=1 Tax=Acorus calamus TaxID=4465 RepID=A0AAV9DPQ4_ACOCL|nr:hypothetical protein QJS10_CPB12g00924 [Acorus calamus]
MPIDEDISEKLKKAEEELDDLKQDLELKGEEIDKLRCKNIAALAYKLGALNNEIQDNELKEWKDSSIRFNTNKCK